MSAAVAGRSDGGTSAGMRALDVTLRSSRVIYVAGQNGLLHVTAMNATDAEMVDVILVVRTTRKGIAAAQGATSAVISNRALRTLVVRPKVAPFRPVGVTG